MTVERLELRAVRYRIEIEIAAPPEVVWRSLTEATDAWWLGDFRVCGADSKVRFEPVPGGHLIEEGADGALVWYSVQMLLPGTALHLVGHIGPDWGGPATSMMKVAVTSGGPGTVLTVDDALFGALDEGTAASLEDGWRRLFGEGLKPHAEGAGG